ncbi:lazarillo protein-like [Achroia grisella]|uniref:lazarillo protein-like n=1 Tax=Achroia grisella TaxID=688607 RepID=UPI0027D1F89F|nr:lazarillo protein-like [Achroia grisella]
MLLYGLFVCLCVLSVESVQLNVSCPVVSPRELDWKALDGKWYITAAATELDLEGAECATLMFNHMNSTDVSISWISNNTASYYNGSVVITVDPNSNSTTIGDLLLITYTDQKAESYSFLDVDYEHYAVLFSCYDSEDGNSSTYEIWKLIRSPHLKESDAIKLDQAVANYSLQDTPFINFNNNESACSTSGTQYLDPSTLIWTSAVAYTLFQRLY